MGFIEELWVSVGAFREYIGSRGYYGLHARLFALHWTMGFPRYIVSFLHGAIYTNKDSANGFKTLKDSSRSSALEGTSISDSTQCSTHNTIM